MNSVFKYNVISLNMSYEISFGEPSHLEDIIKLWGPNRSTLGFMPKDGFVDAINKKWMLIAQKNGFLLGYLMFRYTNKNQSISIVHLCVDKSSRGKGLSTMLLDKLVKIYENTARGIKLSYRSDYIHANAFWQKYNFQPRTKQPSRGSNPSIHLNIWWYKLGSSDLFSFMNSDKIKVILDFNIIAKLRDLSINNEYHDEVAHLLTDYLSTEVEYFQTSETKSEIFRDEDNERSARSKAYIKQFSELEIDKPSINDLEFELREIIKGLSDNDLSDRRQISEAILSGFPYFVTLDTGILKCKQLIFKKYQLKIIEPDSLFLEIDTSTNSSDYYPSKLSGSNFSIKKSTADESDNLSLLFLKHGQSEKKKDFVNKIRHILKNSGRLMLINESHTCVAMVGAYETNDELIVSLIRTKQYNLRQTIFMQNTYDLINLAIRTHKNYIKIEDSFLTHIEKSILSDYGFYLKDNCYIRGIYNKSITRYSLSDKLSHITDKIPELKVHVKTLSGSLTKEEIALNTYLIEKKLWPIKISDADIPCFIIPIKPAYARQLFDTKAAKLDLYGTKPILIWNKENVYYRNIKPNIETFPARILWYASSDNNAIRQKAIVCSSYLDEVVVGPAKELFTKYEKYGVFSWKNHIHALAKYNIDTPIKILKFSDSESFENLVPLQKIKNILKECGEKDNNFQSPLQIQPSTFMKLYLLGKG